MSAMDPAWPVLVTIEETGITTALMNRKAFRKSLETGTPWIVHPAGLRVLPWPGEPEIISLEEAAGCFLLTLPEHSVSEPYGKAAPPDVDPDDRSAMTGNAATAGDGAAGAAAGSAGSAGDGIMAELSSLIAARHKEMPEGSYTTHLFEKGLDKIRKKAGEEAVELLLARDCQDVIYESADLVYHLLVLLEAEGLSWDEVTAELARRHS